MCCLWPWDAWHLFYQLLRILLPMKDLSPSLANLQWAPLFLHGWRHPVRYSGATSTEGQKSPIAQEVKLLNAIVTYEHIRYLDGRESSVSLRNLPPCPLRNDESALTGTNLRGVQWSAGGARGGSTEEGAQNETTDETIVPANWMVPEPPFEKGRRERSGASTFRMARLIVRKNVMIFVPVYHLIFAPLWLFILVSLSFYFHSCYAPICWGIKFSKTLLNTSKIFSHYKHKNNFCCPFQKP